MLPASHIIIVAPAGVMELVDVADSKASTSGSTACYKSLDFSRLSGYNRIRGFCEFSPSSLRPRILELSQ